MWQLKSWEQGWTSVALLWHQIKHQQGVLTVWRSDGRFSLKQTVQSVWTRHTKMSVCQRHSSSSGFSNLYVLFLSFFLNLGCETTRCDDGGIVREKCWEVKRRDTLWSHVKWCTTLPWCGVRWSEVTTDHVHVAGRGLVVRRLEVTPCYLR